jgi:hypothetical protein
MDLGASPTVAYVTDAGLGVGLNFGAGILRMPMSANGSVIHLTSAENAATIAADGKIGGQFGIFGLNAGQIPESQWARQLLIGRGNRSTPVIISGDAVGAFRPPPLIGPFNQIRALFGVRSTSLGSVDLTSGTFIPNEVFSGGQFSQASFMSQFVYYGHEGLLMIPDIGFSAVRLNYSYAQGQITEDENQLNGICKNPGQ